MDSNNDTIRQRTTDEKSNLLDERSSECNNEGNRTVPTQAFLTVYYRVLLGIDAGEQHDVKSPPSVCKPYHLLQFRSQSQIVRVRSCIMYSLSTCTWSLCSSGTRGNGMVSDTEEKISLWRKIAFGLGGPPNQLTHTLIGFQLNAFLLSDWVKLQPRIVGAIVLLGRVWDALMDPTVGVMTTRTR